MHRRLSAFVRSPSNGNEAGPSTIKEETEGEGFNDSQSVVSTIAPAGEAVLAPPSLQVKRVDFYYSKWTRSWKYRNMNSKVVVESRPMAKSGDNDPWKDFAFVIVRSLPKHEDMNQDPTFKIVVKSEYILKICKEVIQSWPGISWNSDPLEMEPEVFLTFLPRFITYKDKLATQKSRTLEEKYLLSSVTALINTLEHDYRSTIFTIKNLTAHKEITFQYLYALFVPRTTLVARCGITGEARAFHLVSLVRTAVEGKPCYQLLCESVDQVESQMGLNGGVSIGRVQTTIIIPFFRGTVRIETLDAYPIQYHSDEAALTQKLIQRGKKWKSLNGVHHKFYNGLAALKSGNGLIKHNVHGRVMVDRATFRRLNTNYTFPTPVTINIDANGQVIRENDQGQLNDPFRNGMQNPHLHMQQHYQVMDPNQTAVQGIIRDSAPELTDDDFILTPAVVYGFSLGDKAWLEFSVDKVQEINWNEDAFANLVLPKDRKVMLQSLVEAHHRELGLDDFIKGKGQGLVINLFGPPGVGKTFSAEATSEHVRRPLYVVGAGDLGTRAGELDMVLERVFDVATQWKAIVLIDEADVFLEQRSLHDLERNASVAVFLRHVEYYRGILFLTTNRVQAFDEAFLSRIHVALHFRELSETSKAQVWTAFMKKVNTEVTPEQLTVLSKRDINGRQIKNATRTAHSLSVGRGETLAFEHFLETLDAMDDFSKEFRAMKN